MYHLVPLSAFWLFHYIFLWWLRVALTTHCGGMGQGYFSPIINSVLFCSLWLNCPLVFLLEAFIWTAFCSWWLLSRTLFFLIASGHCTVTLTDTHQSIQMSRSFVLNFTENMDRVFSIIMSPQRWNLAHRWLSADDLYSRARHLYISFSLWFAITSLYLSMNRGSVEFPDLGNLICLCMYLTCVVI